MYSHRGILHIRSAFINSYILLIQFGGFSGGGVPWDAWISFSARKARFATQPINLF